MPRKSIAKDQDTSTGVTPRVTRAAARVLNSAPRTTRRSKAKTEEPPPALEELPAKILQKKTNAKKTKEKVIPSSEVDEVALTGSKRSREVAEESRTIGVKAGEQENGKTASSTTTDDEQSSGQPKKRPCLLATVDEVEGKTIIRSLPAGKRWWKPVQQQKFSMVTYKAQKSMSTSWEKKMQLRKEKQRLKEFQAELKEQRDAAIEASKQKKIEKRKRKAENEMKNAKIQVISKTEKIKKMSKKQLRTIRKTQVDHEGNVQFVPIYSK